MPIRWIACSRRSLKCSYMKTMTEWFDDRASIGLFCGVPPSVVPLRRLARQQRNPLDQLVTKAFGKPSFILRGQILGHRHAENRKAAHQPATALAMRIEVQADGVQLRA